MHVKNVHVSSIFKLPVCRYNYTGSRTGNFMNSPDVDRMLHMKLNESSRMPSDRIDVRIYNGIIF